MCQPRRPSPAASQNEARQACLHIAHHLQDALDTHGAELTMAVLESVVRRLLERDIIRAGGRPVVEPPMVGQTTIEEMLDG